MNEVTEATEQQAQSSARNPLPWNKLREAREKQNLAQSDIANELRIDLRFIKAIDEGEIEKLPEPVFTAGYIRGYAKLVGLPADELVAGLTGSSAEKSVTKFSPKKAEEENLPTRYGKIPTTLPKSFSVSVSSQDNLKMVRYFIIGLAVVVIAAVVWQMDNSAERNTNLNLDDVSDVEVTGAEPQPVSNTVTTPAKEKVVKGVNRISENLKTVELAIPGQVRPEDVARGIVDENGRILRSNAEKVSKISLQFSENSWVDIRDATGKHLIRKLGIAGNERIVKGVAPFEVLLGNGAGVSIEYNGKPYDFSEFQARNQVARFVIQSVGKPTISAGNEKSSNFGDIQE